MTKAVDEDKDLLHELHYTRKDTYKFYKRIQAVCHKLVGRYVQLKKGRKHRVFAKVKEVVPFSLRVVIENIATGKVYDVDVTTVDIYKIQKTLTRRGD